MRQQIQNLVGAGAANDAVGIEPEGAADRLAQHARRTFRIILQMRRRLLVDRHRLRRRSEGRFVGRQLEHLVARLRHRGLARRVGRNLENAGIRHGAGHLQLRIIGGSQASPFGGTVYRVAWLPTRADERTDAPASIRADLMFSRLLWPATETSSAAPSKAVSGTATISASGDSARAISAFQPETRMLHISTSVTMALSATRETTNTGKAAGWSARSTKGSRAMIFGAPSASSVIHHGVRLDGGGTRARSPLPFHTPSHA